MSEFTEQTVATLETLVDDMTTMTLVENPGITTIPIITNIPSYHIGFPEDDRGKINRACAWCRDLECTDPECVTMLQLEEEAKERTCLACNQVFSTDRELEEHYAYCNCIDYTEYSYLYCNYCGSYFENQEQLDYHDTELCYQQQQEQVIYCKYCGLAFETREQLYQHSEEQCQAFNATHECWNEYELSRMDDCYDQDELEQERMDDLHQQSIEENETTQDGETL